MLYQNSIISSFHQSAGSFYYRDKSHVYITCHTGSFSRIAVCEVISRQSDPDTIEAVRAITGIQHVAVSSDGPLQRLTLHTSPDTRVEAAITEILGEGNIDYIVMRDPSLEEAYLSIIK